MDMKDIIIDMLTKWVLEMNQFLDLYDIGCAGVYSSYSSSSSFDPQHPRNKRTAIAMAKAAPTQPI